MSEKVQPITLGAEWVREEVAEAPYYDEADVARIREIDDDKIVAAVIEAMDDNAFNALNAVRTKALDALLGEDVVKVDDGLRAPEHEPDWDD